MARPRVVIGFLGTTMDAGKDNRWERWRPTVALCQHEDFLVDRLELLHDDHAASLAERVARDIAQVSPETKVRAHILNFSDPWDFQEVYGAMRDFADAFPFDTEKEDYLVNITTGTHVAQICWFLLVEAHYVPAKILQLTPPKRWRDGGAGKYDIIDLDLARYDKIATRFAAEKAEATSFLKSGISTRNEAFNRMIERIEQVAALSKAPLLLTGPTGAGKSRLASRIYELKKTRHRLRGPFVEVNCATLRGDGAMSALFGHAKGAFTGALADRPGLLRKADGGILFLDEIGELGLDEQAMILRAIEEKRFLPLGADKEAMSDFQLIVGTNRDLSLDVAKGKFREDLLARLDLWTFELPALKDRREDIEPNLDFELTRFSEREGARATFNREARERYLAFARSDRALWRGNFRDLGASVTRMATLAPARRITEDIVVEEIARLERSWSRGGAEGPEALLRQFFDEDALAGVDLFDRVQLAAVVRVCRAHSSLSAAGRALFSASRAQRSSVNDADRLRKYLARFELDWKAITTT
ncbi:RNA repair transcriptional activator RtcR [Methylosinus sp. Sm6]|uniref:RNA repair transcriptional activator RtcR n=1 Tax=Methylosinus sp. Sm6 TaxID=2866948 RepID=UPI001C9970DF|nr:RNA repair transcriptional activator RtcR [Methylosinus sp. Sm6]MBY6241833.1 RNA repair transcriptional activator RtcR [Methylosinus sp. Sm6]